jgi:hypothetical protein
LVQKHQLIAFRRIAAKVYKKNLKWKRAVNMATKDGLFVDAMETASQSNSSELVKDLLSFFIEVCCARCAACARTFSCSPTRWSVEPSVAGLVVSPGRNCVKKRLGDTVAQTCVLQSRKASEEEEENVSFL